MRGAPSHHLRGQVRRALERLVSFGQYQDGPRLDAQEFCERLIAHRPLYPARLEEEARPAVLVLPDVSGSCAGFSNRTRGAWCYCWP